MLKRMASGPLWFIAVWALVGFVETSIGAPRSFGPVLGIAAAAFVMLDPFGLFWPRSKPAMPESKTPEFVGASPSH